MNILISALEEHAKLNNYWFDHENLALRVIDSHLYSYTDSTFGGLDKESNDYVILYMDVKTGQRSFEVDINDPGMLAKIATHHLEYVRQLKGQQ